MELCWSVPVAGFKLKFNWKLKLSLIFDEWLLQEYSQISTSSASCMAASNKGIKKYILYKPWLMYSHPRSLPFPSVLSAGTVSVILYIRRSVISMQISLVIVTRSYSVIDFPGPWLYHGFPSWCFYYVAPSIKYRLRNESKKQEFTWYDGVCVCTCICLYMQGHTQYIPVYLF